MASKMPPVPPANRSPKGPGADPSVKADETRKAVPENPDEQGQQGNTKQNTPHQRRRIADQPQGKTGD